MLSWVKGYSVSAFGDDALAALIVTIMLIPQSLAYAMLAGLPPQMGLYASILPLIAYAIFGTSRTLAVGPVAVLSLMTAAAAGQIAPAGSAEYIGAAIMLAVLSGGILVLMGLFRLGFLANFLSHPVVSGFITASGIIIAASQMKHLLGVDAHGHSLLAISRSLAGSIADTHLLTLVVGAGALSTLLAIRYGLKPLLTKLGLPSGVAAMAARAGPVFVVIASIAIVAALNLDARGLPIVGEIPTGLPRIAAPPLDFELAQLLLLSAGLIALIGFVESVSVAQTLAAKKRQRIDPNRELIGLGAAGLASGFSQGFPVTGGFARSAVNFDAGARTQAAGALTAMGIALAALFLTPFLFHLPQAVLAATIIVAVLTLVDFKAVHRTYVYSKPDFAAMLATIMVTLVIGVEMGVVSGVALSLLLHLYNSSRPHFAIVGQVPGTHHFRNVNRHAVGVAPHALTIRIDESLYFANARFLEDTVYAVLNHRPDLRHLVLMCPAVNKIDASALESLEAINARLKETGVCLHLSEVKGPVMDALERTSFLDDLTGEIHLSQLDAMREIDPAFTADVLAGNAQLTTPSESEPPSEKLGGIAAVWR
jgi:SulP family sulfate permease